MEYMFCKNTLKDTLSTYIESHSGTSLWFQPGPANEAIKPMRTIDGAIIHTKQTSKHVALMSNNMEVSQNRGTTSYHPFIDTIFHEIN